MAIAFAPSLLRFPISQGCEPVQRIQVAENFRNLALESAASCRSRRELAAHNPALQLFPIFRVDGPSRVLRPFALFGGIPIAFVLLSETASLALYPFRILSSAGTGQLRESRSL